jgi:arginine/ornithine N-succinyltransferase beta subunit
MEVQGGQGNMARTAQDSEVMTHVGLRTIVGNVDLETPFYCWRVQIQPTFPSTSTHWSNPRQHPIPNRRVLYRL